MLTATEMDQAREIAERVARRLNRTPTPSGSAKPGVSAEIAAVRAGIDDLQRKLAQLEAKVGPSSTSIPAAPPTNAKPMLATHSPWLAGINSSYSHPSEERFGVEEATVTKLVDFLENEKVCTVEPGGKPCDHCSMCSSRGF